MDMAWNAGKLTKATVRSTLGLACTIQAGVPLAAAQVVNDSIVLVSFIKLRLKEGKPVHEAVHLAGMQRFRAVFLTSATTVFSAKAVSGASTERMARSRRDSRPSEPEPNATA